MPDVPEATETWLVKISMSASETGWWVLASLTWTFSVTSGVRKRQQRMAALTWATSTMRLPSLLRVERGLC